MEKHFDIVIAGAGPSGLAAALTAKTEAPELSVALVEKKEEPAKKLRASGNGRCNMTNSSCEDLAEVLRFFSQAGIATRTDAQGRIYPYSEEAGAVADTLVREALRLGVHLMTSSGITGVEAAGSGFRIFISGDSLSADRLLIATGGKSFPAYGSTGDGYAMARAFGHNIDPPMPALTAIEVKEDVKSLKGVRTKAAVSLFGNGALLFSESGEVQFREDCISGICIMNISSGFPRLERGQYRAGGDRYPGIKICMDLAPEFSAAALMEFLGSGRAAGGKTALELTATLIKAPLGAYVLARAGIETETPAETLSEEKLLDIASVIRALTFSPCGLKGWKEAQVTRGGVYTDEIGADMQSKLKEGLYFAGEVTDYDGPCGGYNLHNAWLTGIRAGRAMALSARAERKNENR